MMSASASVVFLFMLEKHFLIFRGKKKKSVGAMLEEWSVGKRAMPFLAMKVVTRWQCVPGYGHGRKTNYQTTTVWEIFSAHWFVTS